MAFDMGFDFRNTAGFVSDPAYGVPGLLEVYPHTYTNSNGNSINAGWDDATGMGSINNTAGNDPRIAGINDISNGAGLHPSFQVDLSSGSAPGAGNYTVDIAFGDSTAARVVDFKLFDNATLLIDGTNGGSGFSTASGHYIDATLADVAATTNWTGATVSKTFATTTAKLQIAIDALSSFTTVDHFRLTLVPLVNILMPQGVF